LEEGARVQVYDPEAMDNVKRLYNSSIIFGKDQYSILEGVDALIIATEWPLFRTPNFKRMASLMKTKIIFDGRNLFEPDKMETTGFYYESIGRRRVNAPLTISKPMYSKVNRYNKVKKVV
jgi:UDPglucose 6-dehydrogenase